MSSYYSVIRYVPDPIADESINIGVLAFEGRDIRFQFINNWNRARIFGSESVSFLRDFTNEVLDTQGVLFGEKATINEEIIRSIFGAWKNSIQFSEVRASLKPIDELIGEIVSTYLSNSIAEKAPSYDKAHLLGVAQKQMKHAVINRFGRKAGSVVKKGYILEGKDAKHDFDLVVANGNPYLGVFAVSFKVRESARLRKSVDAAAFAIEDVQRTNQSLPLALVTSVPREKRESYDRACQIFNQLDVPLVRESEIGGWAESLVKKLPECITFH